MFAQRFDSLLHRKSDVKARNSGVRSFGRSCPRLNSVPLFLHRRNIKQFAEGSPVLKWVVRQWRKVAVISQNRQQQGAPGWLPNRANKFTSRLVAYTALQIIGYFATDILADSIRAVSMPRSALYRHFAWNEFFISGFLALFFEQSIQSDIHP